MARPELRDELGATSRKELWFLDKSVEERIVLMRIWESLEVRGADDLLEKPEEMAPMECRCRLTSFFMKALPQLSDAIEPSPRLR